VSAREGSRTATARRLSGKRHEESTMQKLTRDQMAPVARDIPEGAYVIWASACRPSSANHLPNEREVFLHSENGCWAWAQRRARRRDYDLINAGQAARDLLPGGAYFHHADSFAMMRGGHLDICVWARSRCRPPGSRQCTRRRRCDPRGGRRDGPPIGARRPW